MYASLELYDLQKDEGSEREKGFRLFFRGLTAEQLASMNIWKHLSIKLDYKLFCTDTLCILCSVYTCNNIIKI